MVTLQGDNLKIANDGKLELKGSEKMNIEERIARLEKAVQAIMDLPVMTNLAQKDPRIFKQRAINLAIEKSAELESLPADEQDKAKKLILKCVYSAAPALSLEHYGNS